MHPAELVALKLKRTRVSQKVAGGTWGKRAVACTCCVYERSSQKSPRGNIPVGDDGFLPRDYIGVQEKRVSAGESKGELPVTVEANSSGAV